MEPLKESMANTIIIVIPVYNDWTAAFKLIQLLDTAVSGETESIQVLLVDDGSTQPLPQETASAAVYKSIARVDILRLRRNLGHQRAIAVGLCYTEQHLPCRAVVVMDGDGEDVPSDVSKLLQCFKENNESKAIFAERARRTETLLFRVFYRLYKSAHLLLTGNKVRVGNFSVLPASLLTRIVCVSDLWNHYAAAAYKARLPIETIPLSRGYRLDGESKMNFVSLVIHGLSAMSVHGARIGVRLLVAATIAFIFLVCILVAMVLVRFGFGIALPNFVKTAALILILVIPQMLAVALMFVFIVLAGRDSSSFLPIRDYVYFVQNLQSIWSKSEK